MSPETHTHTEVESAALRSFKPRYKRRILCAFPRYSYSFGTFNHAFPLMGDVKGFMPPQGILVVTALIPDEWEIKFVDENINDADRILVRHIIFQTVREQGRAVQFLIFGDDIEQKVEIERGAPSGIFDVFASVRAEQIIGEGA